MPPISIMIKPASSLCNLRCTYCFYHDVAEHRDTPRYEMMQQDTAQAIVEKALRFADGEQVSFAFQGGEPLLAGLGFFQQFTAHLKAQNHKKSPVFLGLQTNGLCIDEAWARFLHKENFLVGLSLDGDREGNRYRVDGGQNNSYHKILRAAALLEKHRVEFNILTVLTGDCARNIERIYRFFKGKGYRYLQFIPCLRPFGDHCESPLYMTSRQYADFLIRAFNLYVKDYVRGDYVSVRQLDNFVQLYLGRQPEQCGMRGHCTFQFVAEGNGNIYPCDFYCVDEWLLGNIHAQDFAELSRGETIRRFINESLEVEPRCKACKYYGLCRGGGCKRTQESADYCEAYQAFFDACLPLFRVFINEK